MAPSKSPDAFRTISEVADWLGVNAHVLRFWESKFSQVKPVKRAGGRRYYRKSDMELLGGIKQLLHDDGLTIKGAQKVLREQGVKAVCALSKPIDDGAAQDEEASVWTRPPDPQQTTASRPEPADTEVTRGGARAAPSAGRAAAPSGDELPSQHNLFAIHDPDDATPAPAEGNATDADPQATPVPLSAGATGDSGASLSDQPTPEQIPPDQQPPVELPPDQLPPNELPPDQQPPDEVPPDQQPPNELPPDQQPPDELPPNQQPPDELPPDQQPPDQQPPDELPPDQQPPDELPPDQQPPDELPPDQQPPDELPPDQQPPDELPPAESGLAADGPLPAVDPAPNDAASVTAGPTATAPSGSQGAPLRADEALSHDETSKVEDTATTDATRLPDEPEDAPDAPAAEPDGARIVSGDMPLPETSDRSSRNEIPKAEIAAILQRAKALRARMDQSPDARR